MGGVCMFSLCLCGVFGPVFSPNYQNMSRIMSSHTLEDLNLVPECCTAAAQCSAPQKRMDPMLRTNFTLIMFSACDRQSVFFLFDKTLASQSQSEGKTSFTPRKALSDIFFSPVTTNMPTKQALLQHPHSSSSSSAAF